jgi:MFS family permease
MRAGVLRRNADFRRVWLGDAVSQAGTAVTALALLYVAVDVLHASPLQVGLVTTFQYLAFLVVGLPTGVWIDRSRCRPVLIASDLGRAVLVASVPVATMLHALTIYQLYAVALGTGTFTVFATVAHQSYVPKLVPHGDIDVANGRLEVSRGVAEASGPAVTGYLIGWLTAPVALLADVVSYLASAALLTRVRSAEPEPEPTPRSRGERRIIAEIRAGLGFVTGQPALRVLAVNTATYNLFDTMLTAMFLVLLARELHVPASQVGLVFALGGLGGLAGALLAPSLARAFGQGRAILLTSWGVAAADLAVPLAHRGWLLWLAAAGNALGTLAVVASVVTQLSFRQRICPPHLLGRVNATMRLVAWSTVPLGGVLGGALGQTLGLRPTLWVAAGGVVLAGVPVQLAGLRSMDQAAGLAAAEPAPAGLAEHPPAATGAATWAAAPAAQRTTA